MAITVKKLNEEDLDDVKRLHKYASQGGRPVFSQYGDDAAAVLEAAVVGQDAFGLAALMSDAEEPHEQELVGAVTAQIMFDNNTQQQTTAAAAQQGNNDVASKQQACCEVVLLTLVVRADVRHQGVGRQLLQALLTYAQEVAGGQPLQRVVTDIALNNKPAWQFFERAGFTRGAVSGATAEAVLHLDSSHSPAPTKPRSKTAAAAAVSRAAHASSWASSCKRTVHITGKYGWGTHQVLHLPAGRRPVELCASAGCQCAAVRHKCSRRHGVSTTGSSSSSRRRGSSVWGARSSIRLSCLTV